jgi:hypothetical protein
LIRTRKVFISYANEQATVAEEIAHAIRSRWVEVFLDRHSLPGGDAYDQKIHDAVNASSLLIFLVSPESVKPGKYALTELKFAEKKWADPSKRVLPVEVVPTELHRIPKYLAKLTILKPGGNIAAEVRVAALELLRQTSLFPELIRSASEFRDAYLGGFMRGRARENTAFAKADGDSLRQALRELKAKSGGGRIAANELKERFKSHKILEEPEEVQVTGVFFPTTLIAFGWWDRSIEQLGSGIDAIKWQDPSMQKWLFSGFQEWAPSWDLNDWSNKSTLDFVGQIGTYDEADSIPVLIKSDRKAKKLRDDMADSVVANAVVVGLLCHQSHFESWKMISEADRKMLIKISKSFSSQYCILINDDTKGHDVELRRGEVDHYSGYVWNCLAPNEWLPADPGDVRLPNSYFVWEHTNLANADVRRFGLDCLDNKVALLQKRLRETKNISGDLTLLQHLTMEQKLRGEAGPHGEPVLPTEYFRNFLNNPSEDGEDNASGVDGKKPAGDDKS